MKCCGGETKPNWQIAGREFGGVKASVLVGLSALPLTQPDSRPQMGFLLALCKVTLKRLMR